MGDGLLDDAYEGAEWERLKAKLGLWVLHPRQRVAEDLSGQVFELLYGGAGGGGKSDWLLWHHYHLAERFPGHHSLILRNTYKELSRSLIPKSFERFDRSVASYKGQDHTWFFANGSSIEFGYLEGPFDHLRYHSAEYQCVSFDELTTFTREQYTYLFSRCRATVELTDLGVVPHMCSGTNPGGPGGLWVKKRFVDPAPPGQVFTAPADVDDDEEPDADDDPVLRVFVPALALDNPSLDQRTYRRSLKGMTPKLRAALRDGRWDVVEGQFFEEWDPAVHVCEPFEVPREWVRIRAVDYGYDKPYACLWLAFDPDGGAWLYRESYRRGLIPPEQAGLMLAMSERADRANPNGLVERIDYTVADPSCWTKTGIGDPIAQQWYMAGLRGLRKAMNARVDGWARVRTFLRADSKGHVRLHVFSSCRSFIETFPQLVYDSKDPEDLDTDGEDHLADALRYGLMSRPRSVRARGRDAPDSLQAAVDAKVAGLGRRRKVFHPELGWVAG